MESVIASQFSTARDMGQRIMTESNMAWTHGLAFVYHIWDISGDFRFYMPRMNVLLPCSDRGRWYYAQYDSYRTNGTVCLPWVEAGDDVCQAFIKWCERLDKRPSTTRRRRSRFFGKNDRWVYPFETTDQRLLIGNLYQTGEDKSAFSWTTQFFDQKYAQRFSIGVL